jgi:CrcB protein
MSPWGWAGLAVAGAIGAPLRYVVDAAVADRVDGVFPWGTFLINASGALLLGFLTGLGLYHAFPRTPRIVLGTGFVGAYTTFSTFTYETERLVEEGAPAHAMANAFGTLVAGAVFAAAGLALAAL